MEVRSISESTTQGRLFEPVALREAVINAIIHNDYSYEGVPKFELFADRLEITSTGGIPQGLSEAEFFEGYSMPRNKELMRIFRDLDLVEQLGSGMPRILQAYPKTSFHFTDNFIRMVIPVSGKSSGESSGKIIQAIQENGQITIPELAQAIGISTRAVEKQIARLRDSSLIRRVGHAKGGYWEITPAETRD